MRTALFLLVFITMSYTASTQAVEVFTQLGYNKFYDLGDPNGHFASTYTNDGYYGLGIRFDNLAFANHSVNLVLRFENIQGELSVSNGGNGGGSMFVATADKYLLGLGIYPLSFSLFRKISLSFGGEINFLVRDDSFAERWLWSIGTVPDKMIQNGRIGTTIGFGLGGQVAYKIPLGKTWYLHPRYCLLAGFTNEFQNNIKSIKSFRHSLAIGVAKRLGK